MERLEAVASVPHLNLVVLRAKDPRALARFYTLLGFEFAEEKHGMGREHLSCSLGDYVFEIYPLAKGERDTTATRIGFRVVSLEDALQAVSGLSEELVLQRPQTTKWGRRALIMDPEGHRVELAERDAG